MTESGGRRTIRRLAGCVAMVAGMLPSPAWSKDMTPHEIFWAQMNPVNVKSFVVFVSPVKGDSGSARKVAIPKSANQNAETVQTFSAIVSMLPTEFVAVAAVGHDGQMSALSTWSGAPPSSPGQPFVVEH